MSEVRQILDDLMKECGVATAHFHTWWALRNLALPKFYEAMNDYSYVDFFHASNTGHYKLFFVALAKIFDRDVRVSGISHLRDALRKEGHRALADELAMKLSQLDSVVSRVMGIRNKAIVHNERGLTKEKVYEINGITPDEIRELIRSTREAINAVADALKLPDRVSDGRRHEEATLAMLERLARGKT
jgi:hypothetical protein